MSIITSYNTDDISFVHFIALSEKAATTPSVKNGGNGLTYLLTKIYNDIIEEKIVFIAYNSIGGCFHVKIQSSDFKRR